MEKKTGTFMQTEECRVTTETVEMVKNLPEWYLPVGVLALLRSGDIRQCLETFLIVITGI